MYYAKARFYDAENRRFVAVDPILDPSQHNLKNYVVVPMLLVQYLYVQDNAINAIDPDGKLVLTATGVIVVSGVVSALISGGTELLQQY